MKIEDLSPAIALLKSVQAGKPVGAARYMGGLGMAAASREKQKAAATKKAAGGAIKKKSPPKKMAAGKAVRKK